MATRDRIIDAAIALFNESGTGAISTNHIARAAGISPGNLYYHFPNKEAIIRAVFERMSLAWRRAAELPAHRSPGLIDLRRILRGNFTVLRQYRFYYRELPALIRRDSALAEQYLAVRRTGLATIEHLLRGFIEAGVLNGPADPRAQEELAQACWILADFWLPFAELSGDPVGPEQAQRGEQLILRILRPYFTESSLREIADCSDISILTVER